MGLMKGQGGGYGGNGSRGRPYGMMLLLAFGAAIIGVMLLHSFRERRIFNLLIKDKDTHLISLQLLLQKERDHLKEAKQKLGDMRATIHTLWAKKRELYGKIMEMQSTVTSLRDEQKMIESALEEKQNEIKMLRDGNIHVENEKPVENENPQVSLRDKEPEIETDDPSNASQMKTRSTERDEINVKQQRGDDAELNISTNQEVGENLKERADNSRGDSGNKRYEEDVKQGEVRRENGGKTAETRKMTKEQSQKQDRSEERNTEERTIERKEMKGDISQDGGEGKRTAKTETVENNDREMQRPRDELHTSDNKVTEFAGAVMGSNGQDAENKEFGADLKGGMKKLEMPDNTQIGRHTRKGRKSNLKRAKGRRWTITTRSKAGNSENNEVVMSDKGSLGSTSAEKLDINESQNKSSSMTNETAREDPAPKIPDNLKKGEASEHEDVGKEARNTASYIQMEERGATNGTSEKTETTLIFLNDGPKDTPVQTDDNKASSEGEQSAHGTDLPEEQITGIQQLAEEIALQKEDDVFGKGETFDIDEEPSDPGIGDLQEQESETETSRETRSNSEGEGKERKGNNDKPEI